jgi:hypothetical protein
MCLLVIFSVASLMQLVVGALIDRYPLKNVYLPILLCQVPLFLLASQARWLGAGRVHDRCSWSSCSAPFPSPTR